MSSRRVSLSSVLDRLEGWGEPPVVNPVRSKDRVTPGPEVARAEAAPGETPGPAAASRQSVAQLVGLAICAFIALSAILVVWLLTTSASTGFIYAQF